MTAPRAILTLLASLFVATRELGAQVPSARADRYPVEIGFDAGWSGDASVAFSNDQICPSRRGFSGGFRARARLGRRFGTEAVGQVFFGNPDAGCVNGLQPPPPPTGPFTRRYDFFDERVTGYPFALTTARLQFLPYADPAAEVRLSVGVGRMWSKHLTVPEAGFSVALGRRIVRLLAEVTFWWYRVPEHRITEDFQDGRLVSRRDDVVQVRQRTAFLRAGLMVPIRVRTP
jgi:hypothetical protein